MKIYEIGTGYTPIPAQLGAATEIVVEELTRSFIRLGESVEIIDIAAEKRASNDLPIVEVKVPSIFTKDDVSLGIMHKLKRVVYSLGLAQKLKGIIKKSNEDVVLHFHNQYNLFFFLKTVPQSIRNKVKIAYTVHSYIWSGDWKDIETTIGKRYFQEVFCINSADVVFVLNEKTRNNIVDNIKTSDNKIVLINNGVNTEKFAPITDDKKQSLKEKYGLKNKKIFIQTGSVCERKNQLTSVKLLSPLMKENPDIVFCYAGGIISEEYQKAIADYSEANGIKEQVLFLGELNPNKELVELYSIAEAMVFPSTAEGFSLVILESMSAGVPVIIHKDLKFDLWFDCLKFKEQSDFCELVRTNILNVKVLKEKSSQSRKTMLENYGWSKISEDYLSEFNNLFL